MSDGQKVVGECAKGICLIGTNLGIVEKRPGGKMSWWKNVLVEKCPAW